MIFRLFSQRLQLLIKEWHLICKETLLFSKDRKLRKWSKTWGIMSTIIRLCRRFLILNMLLIWNRYQISLKFRIKPLCSPQSNRQLWLYKNHLTSLNYPNKTLLPNRNSKLNTIKRTKGQKLLNLITLSLQKSWLSSQVLNSKNHRVADMRKAMFFLTKTGAIKPNIKRW